MIRILDGKMIEVFLSRWKAEQSYDVSHCIMKCHYFCDIYCSNNSCCVIKCVKVS